MNDHPGYEPSRQSEQTDGSEKQQNGIGHRVLVKNNQFLIIDKPAGLPTQPGRTPGISLLTLAQRFVGHPLHLIHRIDQAAAGCVLLAQSALAAARLNAMLQNGEITRTYWAVVSGQLDRDQGDLTDWLIHDKRFNKSRLVEEGTADSVQALAHYRLLASSERYHLLEVTPITGRPHQIRVQLAARGLFIKGDVKYGARRSNPDRSIHLLSRSLSFNHPLSGNPITATASLPQDSLWDLFRKKLGTLL